MRLIPLLADAVMARLPEWPALVAIALWASLATVAGASVDDVAAPALLAVALGAAAVGLAAAELVRGRRPAELLAPRPADLALAVYGLGGYHVLLFLAFARAPLVEANLLNYLWPLLTVLLARPLCGEPLRGGAVAGAALGLAGTALVVAADGVTPSGAWLGYTLAVGAALCWSSFSNLLKARPLATPALPAAAALAAAGCALWTLVSGAAWPSERALLGALYLGALPMGLATLFWEAGLRRGRVSVVGSLGYTTPLLSTLSVWLVLGRPMPAASALGGALILAGAALGAHLPPPARSRAHPRGEDVITS